MTRISGTWHSGDEVSDNDPVVEVEKIGPTNTTDKSNNRRIAEMLETLVGIELLEYHNMNLLAGDNKRRNETKRAILAECLLLTGKQSDIASL